MVFALLKVIAMKLPHEDAYVFAQGKKKPALFM